MNIETELSNSKKHFTLRDKKFILSLLTIDGVGRRTAKKIIYFLIKHELNLDRFWVNKNSVWQKCHLSSKSVESVRKVKKEHTNIRILNLAKILRIIEINST